MSKRWRTLRRLALGRTLRFPASGSLKLEEGWGLVGIGWDWLGLVGWRVEIVGHPVQLVLGCGWGVGAWGLGGVPGWIRGGGLSRIVLPNGDFLAAPTASNGA